MVDANIATHLRQLLGERISTEGWGIEADAGDSHRLNIRITMPPAEVLSVIERLIPHVRAFSAVTGTHRGEPGVEINASLMVDIREIVSIMSKE